MQRFPYELLQLISSNLLPKYQCRFALVNKHHYQYLYSHLLQWHARKHQIPVPRYKIPVADYYISTPTYRSPTYYISLREHNGMMCINTLLGCRDVTVINLTKCRRMTVYLSGSRLLTGNMECKMFTNFMRDYGASVFDGFYKYMRRDIFIGVASIRLSPLLSLPGHLLINIMTNISPDNYEILHNTHVYFSILQ